MKILILGGTRFLGQHLVDAALPHGNLGIKKGAGPGSFFDPITKFI